MFITALIGYRSTGGGVGVRLLKDPRTTKPDTPQYVRDSLESAFRIKSDLMLPVQNQFLFRVSFLAEMACFCLYTGTVYPGDPRSGTIVGVGVAINTSEISVFKISLFLVERLKDLIELERPIGTMSRPIEEFDPLDFMPGSNSWFDGNDTTAERRPGKLSKMYSKVEQGEIGSERMAKLIASLMDSEYYGKFGEFCFGTDDRLTSASLNAGFDHFEYQALLQAYENPNLTHKIRSKSQFRPEENSRLIAARMSSTLEEQKNEAGAQHVTDHLLRGDLNLLDERVAKMEGAFQKLVEGKTQTSKLDAIYQFVTSPVIMACFFAPLIFMLVYQSWVISGLATQLNNKKSAVETGELNRDKNIEIEKIPSDHIVVEKISKCFDNMKDLDGAVLEAYNQEIGKLKNCIGS